MAMLSWKKGEKYKYNFFFDLNEFACKCALPSCVTQIIDSSLLDKLAKVRKVHNLPIRVTSGYRCQAHQDSLAAAGLETAKNSQHVLGRAADVASSDMDLLDSQLQQEFKATGRARSFIHVDLRDDTTRRWGYTRS